MWLGTGIERKSVKGDLVAVDGTAMFSWPWVCKSRCKHSEKSAPSNRQKRESVSRRRQLWPTTSTSASSYLGRRPRVILLRRGSVLSRGWFLSSSQTSGPTKLADQPP